MKGIMRFGKKGKLILRFISPYKILEKVGNVAYRLTLPSELSSVHNIFHVSILRRYISDPSHVLSQEPLALDQDLSYKERPPQILDKRVKEFRKKKIPLVKILWCNQSIEETTWELEDEMRKIYPEFFGKKILRTKFL